MKEYRVNKTVKRDGIRKPIAIIMQRSEVTMERKLYKSNKNKMVDGVCGGIAEYFGMDPTLVRLAWVLFCALGGSGILAYLIAAIIIPRNPVV